MASIPEITLPSGGSRGTSGEGPFVRVQSGPCFPSPAATASDPPSGWTDENVLILVFLLSETAGEFLVGFRAP